MWILGVILYLSVGYLIYSYEDHKFKSMITNPNVSQYARRKLQFEQNSNLKHVIPFWPIYLFACLLYILVLTSVST